PGRGVDELLEARDVAVLDQQRDRLDALALGANHQALEVVVGVVLGLVLAEERGEAPVEVDQQFGGGAHVVRRHGGVPWRRWRSTSNRPVRQPRALRLSEPAAKTRFFCCCRNGYHLGNPDLMRLICATYPAAKSTSSAP